MQTIPELLATHPFTQDLAPEHLALIAGCAQNVGFREGDYVFKEGDPADTFYVIREGRVALETFASGRGAVTIQTVRDGDILGWSWLFPPYVTSFDARVIEPTRMVAFDGACLRGKADQDHELGYQLMKRMAQIFTTRLTATRLQLLDVYGHTGA